MAQRNSFLKKCKNGHTQTIYFPTHVKAVSSFAHILSYNLMIVVGYFGTLPIPFILLFQYALYPITVSLSSLTTLHVDVC